MVYPAESFEQKTGFTQIRDQLAGLCLGVEGARLCRQMRISHKYGVVERWQDQLSAYLKVWAEGRELLVGPYPELPPLAPKLTLEGAILSEGELALTRQLLRVLDGVHKGGQWLAGQAALSSLSLLATGVSGFTSELAHLEGILTPEGTIRDTASTELQRLRRMLHEEQRALRRRLESVLRQAQRDGHAPAEAEITVRSGRLVIPVLAESKRQIQGFVHDESASGQTVFLEPGVVLEANNRIRELEHETRRELERILAQATRILHYRHREITEGYERLGLLDFIRAKGRLAQQMRAVRPELTRGRLHLINARNPLLEAALADTGRPLVPLSVTLDQASARILVISGPNAGGKSVALKTIALLTYMLQFGLYIPAGEGSQGRVFGKLMLDIGDEQSLENDLSTYSSHLRHMRAFVEQAAADSLVLIDEFGAGTDPAYGGPIARSVLERLSHQGAFGVVTTHFSALKDLATEDPALANGSMTFDVTALKPLFVLKTGQPGSSFALEIARNNGLDQPLLDRARRLVGADQVRYDEQLIALERERAKAVGLREQLSAELALAERLKKEYEQIRSFLEQHRRQLLTEAKREARALTANANSKVEAAIRQIRESQAEKEATAASRETIRAVQETLDAELPVWQPEPEITADKAEKAKRPEGPFAPQPGDLVGIRDTTSTGRVLQVSGKTVRVQMGDFVTTVKVAQLEPVDGSEARRRQKAADTATAPAPSSSGGRGSLDLTRKQSEFSSTLDIRGQYPSEALSLVEQFLDDALLLGVGQVRIIHGKGNGVLREQVQQQVRRYKQVGQVQYENPDRGGMGVTLVDLV